jgi:hypothetical protein
MKRNRLKWETGVVTLLFSFASIFSTKASAQQFGGLFSQQSEQQKLMIAQIAGYETFLKAIQTGYKISETGLNTANTLETGSFALNSQYFASLNQVSSTVQSNPKRKAIAADYQQIVSVFTTELAWQNQQKLLTPAELDYIQVVVTNLLAKCKLDLDETTQVLTSGKLQMTDAQRISKLDQLYASMQDKQAFTLSFTTKCRKLALARKRSANDRSILKSLYGIQ